jgi:hypothetical protein
MVWLLNSTRARNFSTIGPQVTPEFAAKPSRCDSFGRVAAQSISMWLLYRRPFAALSRTRCC